MEVWYVARWHLFCFGFFLVYVFFDFFFVCFWPLFFIFSSIVLCVWWSFFNICFFSLKIRLKKTRKFNDRGVPKFFFWNFFDTPNRGRQRPLGAECASLTPQPLNSINLNKIDNNNKSLPPLSLFLFLLLSLHFITNLNIYSHIGAVPFLIKKNITTFNI